MLKNRSTLAIVHKIIFQIFLLTSLLFSQLALAKLHLEQFKLKPTVTLETLSGDTTLARLQGLLPLTGNSEEIWFTALDGKIGLNNNGWMFGFGSGFRKVYLENILGTYLFANYSDTPSHNKIWVFNPGLEMLGNIWNMHLNGYIPSQSSIETRSISQAFASDYYHSEYLSFQGHKEFDRLATLETYNHIDFARGLDFSLGRSVPNLENLKVSLGGYHFTTLQNGSINGAMAHLSYQLNDRVSLEARESYDNFQHNRILIGLHSTLKAGGLNTHLLDPIENNNSLISNGYATFSKTSREEKITIGKQAVLAHKNVWFIGGEQDGDGSHEHPWANLTQENVDKISRLNQPETRIYLTPHSHTATIILPQGVSLMGRNSDYTKIDSSKQRPLLLGSLELNGNNTLDAIQLLPPTSKDQTAIFVNNNADNINILNCSIGDKNEVNQYSTGILGNNIKNLDIKNSHIYVSSNTDNAYGIYVHHVDELTLDHSSIEAIASNYSNEKRHSGNAYGVLIGYDFYENNFSNINAVQDNTINIINNSRISASSNSKSTADDTGNAYSILVGYGFGWSYGLDKNLDVSRNSVNLLNDLKESSSNSLIANASNLADYTFLAGNAYGILVGYAAGSDTSTTTANSLAITYNSINIGNSAIVVTGKVANASLASGNAFAVLIGDGYIEGETAYGTSDRKVNLDVSENTIDINKANLRSNGSNGGYGEHSGNSYALTLGFGFNRSTGRQDGIVSSNIDHNTVNITTTTLNASSNNAASYSTLLGYAASEGGSESGKRFLEVKNNKINLTSSVLASNTHGLNLAQNATISCDNNLSVTNTIFNINSDTNAYGIFMQGVNLDSLNISQNTFNVTSENPLNSYGIYNANSTQLWPESLVKTLLQNNQFADSIQEKRRVWQ